MFQDLTDSLNDLEFVRSDHSHLVKSITKLKYKKNTKITKKQKEELQLGFEGSIGLNRKQWSVIVSRIRGIIEELNGFGL